ncbi:MAG: hypothetical protein FD125_1633 [bacterium]|nr:MAG: hypothetical protein FD125_1633 [bacterium]
MCWQGSGGKDDLLARVRVRTGAHSQLFERMGLSFGRRPCTSELLSGANPGRRGTQIRLPRRRRASCYRRNRSSWRRNRLPACYVARWEDGGVAVPLWRQAANSMIEILSALVLMNSVDISTRPQESSVGAGITLSETPLPGKYSLSTQIECGGTNYIVEIESGYATRSRIVKATADGRPVTLSVGSEDLDSLITSVRVVSLQPVACGGTPVPFLQIAVRTYDAALDAQPDHDGETLLVATTPHQ